MKVIILCVEISLKGIIDNIQVLEHYTIIQFHSYLKCRMDNQLMAEESLSNLGLSDDIQKSIYIRQQQNGGARKEQTGYLAGMLVR